MNSKMKLVVIVLFGLSFLTVTAQDNVNMKFGKPTKEEMQMTVYSADSSADAVVLCRLTDVTYTIQYNGYIADYHERIRIKVLKPEGVRHANVTIPYYRDNSKQYASESIEDLKATAFNLENGKTVKSVMSKSLVFNEQLDKTHYRIKFTIPQVKEGTVIEYEFSRHSELFYVLHDWYPQGEIPVVYARLDMNIPAFLLFNIEEHGIQRLVCTVKQDNQTYKLKDSAMEAPSNVRTNHMVCVGRDLKAMPKDSYVWCTRDYCAGITGEMRGYSLPTVSNFVEVAKTWDQIDGWLVDDDEFGVQFNHHSPLREEIEAAQLTNIADEKERIAAVYRMVTAKVAWDGDYDFYPESGKATMKRGSGSNADINLLLIQSLRDAGLNALPVVLRSRDNGLLPYNFPSLQKITTFVVGVRLNSGSIVYVDGSSADGWLDVLPATLQVEKARVLEKGKKSQWANLQKLARTQTISIIEATLTPDGVLHGTQTTQYTGNAAAEFRKTLREAGDSAAYIAQKSEKDHIKIESWEQTDGRGFAPSASEIITFSRQGEVNDGHIYINPFNNLPLSENPFTASERLMPVEFPFTQSKQVIVNIKLPKGYILEDGPKQTIASTPDKSVSGRLLTSTDEGKVQVQYQFNITKLVQSTDNYAALRQMFEMFTEHSRDMLVIKRVE